MEKYSLVVIGSGPGGYVSAIRGAQLGLKVALIERYDLLGGTCLNVGCIPSKALLDSSEHYHHACTRLGSHGIEMEKIGLNFPQMMRRKEGVVKGVGQGLRFLMKKYKIAVYVGHARFVSTHEVEIGEGKRLYGERIIIATGSKPMSLPFISIDKERIITSTEALSLRVLPRHLIVIGGGVIGMELSSVYARLGVKVSVVEYASSLIPAMDVSMGKALADTMSHLGISVHLSSAVEAVRRKGSEVFVSVKKQNETISLEGDYCLVCVGRRSYSEGLAVEKAGISRSSGGQIEVNGDLQTSQPHIYAIGDVIGGMMLAHKASEEGVYAVEHMMGQKPHIHYLLIPQVVYTWPEVAGVGYTEAQLQKQSVRYKSGQFPFKALGRAKASGDEGGVVKVLSRASDDEILGVHIIGARAADMIAAAVTGMEFRASAEDMTRMSYAHPTYMEAFKEACLSATAQRPLHM